MFTLKINSEINEFMLRAACFFAYIKHNCDKIEVEVWQMWHSWVRSNCFLQTEVKVKWFECLFINVVQEVCTFESAWK